VRVVSLNVNGLRAAERKGARALLAELDADDEGRDALVVGDLNIAHAEIDLRNWRANRRTSGFLPEERAWLSEALALGYVDVVRELAGLGNGRLLVVVVDYRDGGVVGVALDGPGGAP
jgi:exonuclease III